MRVAVVFIVSLACISLCLGLPTQHKKSQKSEKSELLDELQANVQTGYVVRAADDNDASAPEETEQPMLEVPPEVKEQIELAKSGQLPVQNEQSRLGYLNRLIFAQDGEEEDKSIQSAAKEKGTEYAMNEAKESAQNAAKDAYTGATDYTTKAFNMMKEFVGAKYANDTGLEASQNYASSLLGANQAILMSVQSTASSAGSSSKDKELVKDRSSHVEPHVPYSGLYGSSSSDSITGATSYAGGPINALTISSSDSSMQSSIKNQGATAQRVEDKDKRKQRMKQFLPEQSQGLTGSDSSMSSIGSGGDWLGYRYNRKETGLFEGPDAMPAYTNINEKLDLQRKAAENDAVKQWFKQAPSHMHTP